MAWHILRLQMRERPSIYEGQFQIYRISKGVVLQLGYWAMDQELTIKENQLVTKCYSLDLGSDSLEQPK
jgi:hypothetical protein